MPRTDSIDSFLERLTLLGDVPIDPEVEGIVDRINIISVRLKRAMEATLSEHSLTLPDWQVLTNLRLSRPDEHMSPGQLAKSFWLSSGAITNRLDRLESLGLTRRRRDPDDRRVVIVELTDAGREAWDAAATVQARRESFFTSALSERERRQLTGLLRKLMLAFDSERSEDETS